MAGNRRWFTGETRLAIAILALAAMAGCSPDDGPFDMDWGLTCSSNRFSAVALDNAESPGHKTPEMAVDRFLNPERPEGLATKLPGESLPKDGWARADFLPTPAGTEPIEGTLPPQMGSVALPEQAFVHRDGDRIDAVLMLRAQPGGWIVGDVHACPR